MDKKLIIYGIRKMPDGKDMWDKIGMGYPNRDGSINLVFNYYPKNQDTKIQIREVKDND